MACATGPMEVIRGGRHGASGGQLFLCHGARGGQCVRNPARPRTGMPSCSLMFRLRSASVDPGGSTHRSSGPASPWTDTCTPSSTITLEHWYALSQHLSYARMVAETLAKDLGLVNLAGQIAGNAQSHGANGAHSPLHHGANGAQLAMRHGANGAQLVLCRGPHGAHLWLATRGPQSSIGFASRGQWSSVRAQSCVP